ncbi:MAG: alpha/beta fold hydrolase [Candidatus Melainabacteria bacterium]|nr:alpha/beta fold hydrolase [Candidatus Melainabacteria bacterium]
MKNAAVTSLVSCMFSLGLSLSFTEASAQAQENRSIETKAALFCIPGLTQHSSTYEHLSKQLAPYGIKTMALDVQGFQTAKRGEKQDQIDFEQTVEQVKSAANSYRKNNPKTPVFVLGESTGGTIALKLAAKYPKCVDGILCSAPTWKVNDRNKIAFLEFLDLTVLRKCKHGLAVNYVIKRTTDDKVLQAHLKYEEGRRQRFSIRESIKFMRFINASPQTASLVKSTPVFVLHGLHDKLGQTRWTAMLFKKIAGSKKTFVLDASAEHLICEEGQCSPKIVETIKNWIEKTANGEANLHPEGVLLSSEDLNEKETQSTKDMFRLAGVIPDTTLAQDTLRSASEVTP